MKDDCIHHLKLTRKLSGGSVINMSHVADPIANSTAPSSTHRRKNWALFRQHVRKHDAERKVAQAVAIDFNGPLLLIALKVKLDKLQEWRFGSWKSTHPGTGQLYVKADMLPHNIWDQLNEKLCVCAHCGRRTG